MFPSQWAQAVSETSLRHPWRTKDVLWSLGSYKVNYAILRIAVPYFWICAWNMIWKSLKIKIFIHSKCWRSRWPLVSVFLFVSSYGDAEIKYIIIIINKKKRCLDKYLCVVWKISVNKHDYKNVKLWWNYTTRRIVFILFYSTFGL